MKDDALVLFPGALGDFICFLPALLGLRARHHGRLRVVAQPSLLALLCLPDSDAVSIHRREVADLFASTVPPAADTVALLGGFAAVYSWSGAGDPQVMRRLSQMNTGSVSVHPFRGMRSGEHAVTYYAHCAGVEPVSTIQSAIADDAQWMSRWVDERRLHGRRLFVMHSGSGARRKNWLGFDAVANAWASTCDDAIIVLHGPAEADRESMHSVPGGVLHLQDLSLPQVAALLRRSALYLGNDSGISHLAVAVGARGVVLFGPTEPQTWAPRGGGLHVVHAPEACGTCGPDVFCTHRLPVGRVIEALGGRPDHLR